MEDSNYIVISLGGSIIVPGEIDTEFLKNFTSLIKEYVKKDHRFIIITGGGATCRKYNNALERITQTTDENLDWMGIAATRLNAELIRISFGELAYEKVLLDPDSVPVTNQHIIVGGGWKPGNSSDLAAIRSAIRVGASKVINLSNIDFVYDKDPNLFTDAKVIKEMTWTKFKEILPDTWTPGINTPFDPIASQEAIENGIEVVIMNGRKLDNLRNYLEDKEFNGTIIK